MPITDGPLVEQVYLNAAQHYLDKQIDSFEVLDARAVQIFSVGSAALPLTVALLNLGVATLDVPLVAVWALSGALAAYGALLMCVIGAGIVRRVDYRPDIAMVRVHSERVNAAVLVRWIANEYQASIERNAQLLARKRRWVSNATILLYVEGVLLAVAALLILVR